jgi:Flp pilus assembly protein TadG
MKTIPFFSHLAQAFASFAQDRRGVSAVEFAMLLPLMITLYLGSVEISDGVGADRKVTLVSRTVADLVSQASDITDTDMANLLKAGSSVIAPYGSKDPNDPYKITELKVTVSEVTIDANGIAKICWSNTKNGTARTVGSTVTLPTALNVASTYLIWSEASYDYKPAIGYVMTGTLTLSDQIYMRPRLSNEVKRNGSSACA